ncbi:MAG: hypothetical protein CMJ72_06885 [Planctomycetaceae bacterium]|nr:hypothetical protein [Planctomycetaceae bacterium]
MVTFMATNKLELPEIPDHHVDRFKWNFTACPTCGVAFETIPNKDGACDECDARFLTRSVQASKAKAIFETGDLEDFKTEKAALDFRRRAIRFLSDTDDVDYLQIESELLEEDPASGPHDVVWNALNNANLIFASQGDLEGSAMILWRQALWLYTERPDTADQYLDILRRVRLTELRWFESEDPNDIIEVSGCFCNGCPTEEFKGTPAEWLERGESALPVHSTCTYTQVRSLKKNQRETGWCGCGFAPSFDDMFKSEDGLSDEDLE